MTHIFILGGQKYDFECLREPSLEATVNLTQCNLEGTLFFVDDEKSMTVKESKIYEVP